MDRNYENVLSYNEEEMVNLCRNNAIYQASEYNFIEKANNKIVISHPYSSSMYANYVAFKNPSFGNKWIFAWVIDTKLINVGSTEITFEIDVWSTWYNRFRLGQAFIEREHVSDDTVGKHTLPEDLELGDYVCNKLSQAEFGGKEANLSSVSEAYIVVGVSVDSNGDGVEGNTYDGLFSALKYYAFTHDSTGISDFNDFISNYSADARAEAIRCVFLLPKKLVSFISSDHSISASNTIGMHWINLHGHESDVTGLNKQIVITTGKLQDNYVPVNNKLLTAPFRFMKVSNNSGIDVTYNYEDFVIDNTNNNPTFIIYSCLSIGGSIRLVPMNYKGLSYNHDEGINMGKFPTLSWVNDEFINWLTQNGVNIGISAIGNLTQVVGGGLMLAGGATAMAGASTMLSGLTGIASTLGQIYQHSKIPTQVEGNINSGDVITASNKNDFIFYDMSIKKEYAKCIDSYFSRFGYKVNIVETPNLKSRKEFNFIKVGGMDELISGNIPASDLEKINTICRKGVTIFHHYNNIGNYTISNPIVS